MEFRYSKRGEGESFASWLGSVIANMRGNNVDKSQIEKVAKLNQIACHIESLCMLNPFHDLIIEVDYTGRDTFIEFVFPIDGLYYRMAEALSRKENNTKSVSQWLWYLTHEQVEQRYKFFEFGSAMVYRRCGFNNLVRVAWVKDIKR